MNRLSVLFSSLFLILIALTPFLCISESLALVFGGITSNSEALTSPFIKGLKDIGFLLFASMFIVRCFVFPYVKNVFVVVLIASLLLVSLAFFYSSNIIVFLIGLRWLFPLTLPILFYPFVSKWLLCKSSLLLDRLLIFQVTLQLLQLFFASNWFGSNALGLSARNPGFFFIPSTAGIFTICVLLFHIYSRPNAELPILLLCSLSIFLTVSATAIILFLIIMFFYYCKDKFFVLSPILLPIPVVLAFFAVTLSSRGADVFSKSFGVRVLIFIDSVFSSSPLPVSFGLGTATSYLVANAYDLDLDSVATESLYASLFTNLGSFAAVLFIACLSASLVISYLNRDFWLFIVLLTVMCCSATVNLTEVYPANMLLAFLFSFALRSRKIAPSSPL